VALLDPVGLRAQISGLAALTKPAQHPILGLAVRCAGGAVGRPHAIDERRESLSDPREIAVEPIRARSRLSASPNRRVIAPISLSALSCASVTAPFRV